MRKHFFQTLSAVCAVTAVCAGISAAGEPSTAQFLRMGIGARAAAMGDAYVAAANDATAVYWNPAGLAQVKKYELTAMYTSWFDDVNFDWFSFACPTKYGTFGAGVEYVSYGRQDKLDRSGIKTGTLDPQETVFALSYARRLGAGLSLGASVKGISSQLEASASSLAADVGAQYPFLDEKLTAGLAVQNIGQKMKYVSAEDPLPMTVKAGALYAVTPEWLVAAEYSAPNGAAAVIGAGTEYGCKAGNDLTLFGRLGYTTLSKDVTGTQGVTAGLGVQFQGYSLDYAYAPFGDLGNTQQVSLSIAF